MHGGVNVMPGISEGSGPSELTVLFSSIAIVILSHSKYHQVMRARQLSFSCVACLFILFLEI